jgi:hypothetical protein
MPLREHGDIAVGFARIVGIVTRHGTKKHGHDLCRGDAARRVATLGCALVLILVSMLR